MRYELQDTNYGTFLEIRDISDRENRYTVGLRLSPPICEIRWILRSCLSWKGGRGDESHEGHTHQTKLDGCMFIHVYMAQAQETCVQRCQTLVSTPVSAYKAQIGTLYYKKVNQSICFFKCVYKGVDPSAGWKYTTWQDVQCTFILELSKVANSLFLSLVRWPCRRQRASPTSMNELDEYKQRKQSWREYNRLETMSYGEKDLSE
jgi:hypothetical protein